VFAIDGVTLKSPLTAMSGAPFPSVLTKRKVAMATIRTCINGRCTGPACWHQSGGDPRWIG